MLSDLIKLYDPPQAIRTRAESIAKRVQPQIVWKYQTLHWIAAPITHQQKRVVKVHSRHVHQGWSQHLFLHDEEGHGKSMPEINMFGLWYFIANLLRWEDSLYVGWRRHYSEHILDVVVSKKVVAAGIAHNVADIGIIEICLRVHKDKVAEVS